MRLIEDVIAIILLIALPDCILEALGIYKALYKIIEIRQE